LLAEPDPGFGGGGGHAEAGGGAGAEDHGRELRGGVVEPGAAVQSAADCAEQVGSCGEDLDVAGFDRRYEVVAVGVGGGDRSGRGGGDDRRDVADHRDGVAGQVCLFAVDGLAG
jgi:hypothetical protein